MLAYSDHEYYTVNYMKSQLKTPHPRDLERSETARKSQQHGYLEQR